MRFNEPKMTARQAAEKFVQTMWEKTRMIGTWQPDKTGVGGGAIFSLVDGVKIYQVSMISGGWEVFETK